MKNLFENTSDTLPFADFIIQVKSCLKEKGRTMLCVKLKKLLFISFLTFAVSSILFATNSYALFEDLTQHGANIFTGMREIIYAVAGFGVVAIAIGGFFGTINWKWLTAIIIGLIVIATTASIINYMVDSNVITSDMITDTLIDGGSATVTAPSESKKKPQSSNTVRSPNEYASMSQPTPAENNNDYDYMAEASNALVNPESSGYFIAMNSEEARAQIEKDRAEAMDLNSGKGYFEVRNAQNAQREKDRKQANEKRAQEQADRPSPLAPLPETSSGFTISAPIW